MRKLIQGYKAASEFSGVKVKTLKNLVARRMIRIVNPLYREVYFDEEHLAEDLASLERKKIE